MGHCEAARWCKIRVEDEEEEERGGGSHTRESAKDKPRHLLQVLQQCALWHSEKQDSGKARQKEGCSLENARTATLSARNNNHHNASP